MAAFAGIDLGLVERYATSANPNDRQLNAYPGVNGLESLELGGRGGRTAVSGVLIAGSEAALESAKYQLMLLQVAGAPDVLVTPDGSAWPSVVMVAFQPAPGRFPMAAPPGYGQRYDAEFLHLIIG